MRQKSLVVQRVRPIISASVSPPGEVACISQETDKVNDSPLNSNDRVSDKLPSLEVSPEKNFLDVLEAARDSKPSNSIITSATQILKEGEHQWLNSEVNF